MKRKVKNKESHRESRRVGRDTEGVFENGLGTAYRMLKFWHKAATGAPVIVPGCRYLYISAADKVSAVKQR
jgi:hypothetical protein